MMVLQNPAQINDTAISDNANIYQWRTVALRGSQVILSADKRKYISVEKIFFSADFSGFFLFCKITLFTLYMFTSSCL